MARRGIQNGSAPFGYYKDPDERKILVQEDEARLVKTAYELYASGNYTDQTIADFMNKCDVKTRRGNKWSKDTVTDFLQNEFYYGKVAYRDELWPGRQEAIITKELFDSVKEVRARHAKRPRSNIAFNKLRRVSLLRKIVCCSQCERPLRVQVANGYGYYIETSKFRGKDCVDSHARVSMKKMDQLVLDLLRNIRLEIELLLQKMDVVREIETRRLEIEEELRRAGRAFADGAFSEDDYDCRRKKLISEKDSLVIPDGAKAIEMGMQLETIGDFIDDATDDEKYKILHILFDSVYYDFGQKRLVGFKPHADFVPIFRLAAPLSGWSESEGSVFRTTV